MQQALTGTNGRFDILMCAPIREILHRVKMRLHDLEKFAAGGSEFKSPTPTAQELGTEEVFKLRQLAAELALAIGISRRGVADSSSRDNLCKCSQPLDGKSGFCEEAFGHSGLD